MVGDDRSAKGLKVKLLDISIGAEAARAVLNVLRDGLEAGNFA